MEVNVDRTGDPPTSSSTYLERLYESTPHRRPSRTSPDEEQEYFQTSSSRQNYVSAIDNFRTIQNKPLVRIFFENYCIDDEGYTLDASALQNLNYDLGVYVPMFELQQTIQHIIQEDKDSRIRQSARFQDRFKNAIMIYEDFLIYWRTHPLFR
jgi:hypothetical protein